MKIENYLKHFRNAQDDLNMVENSAIERLVRVWFQKKKFKQISSPGTPDYIYIYIESLSTYLEDYLLPRFVS